MWEQLSIAPENPRPENPWGASISSDLPNSHELLTLLRTLSTVVIRRLHYIEVNECNGDISPTSLK